MDGFLRFHTLPTWQRRDVDVLLTRLNGTERNRAFVEGFLSAPFEKALARVSQDNYMFGGWASRASATPAIAHSTAAASSGRRSDVRS